MRTDIVKMYKDVHTWVGIISGLALFIAFYAGAITMFETQLERWATAPADISAPPPLEETDKLIDAVHKAFPEARDNYQVHLYPSPDQPARITWQPPSPRTRDMFRNTDFNAASFDNDGALEVKQLERTQMAQLVDVLHQQVGLPFDHDIAMPIMGAIALMYAVALVSGVIILIPSLIKDLFILRRGKNLKRMWLDAHNVLGIFSLPFHIVMACTAVIFAFHDEIYGTQNAVVYGDKVGQYWAVGEVAFPDPPTEAVRLSPSEIVARAKQQAPDFTPVILRYQPARTGENTLLMEGVDRRRIVRGPTTGLLYVDPYTGDFIRTDYMPGFQNGWFQTVISFFALHFGTYGGMSVRWAYFFLGLAGAFLFYSGNLLWIESRRKKSRRGKEAKQRQDTRLLGALTVGISLGCISGISITIAAAKWLHVFGMASGPMHMALYYLVFLISVAWAFLRGAPLAAKELLYACGVSTALIPLTSALAFLWPSGPLWNHGSLETMMVDIVALISSTAFVVMARRTARRLAYGPTDSIWSIKEDHGVPAEGLSGTSRPT